MNFDPNAYNITIRKAVVEGETLYEARVKELPNVIEYADSPDEAYDLAIDTIETTKSYLCENGKAMPLPSIPSDEYSGRVTLRMPKSLHHALCEAASYECVSLNHQIVGILAYHSGFAQGQRYTFDRPWRAASSFATSSPKTTSKRHLNIVRTSEPDEPRLYANAAK